MSRADELRVRFLGRHWSASTTMPEELAAIIEAARQEGHAQGFAEGAASGKAKLLGDGGFEFQAASDNTAKTAEVCETCDGEGVVLLPERLQPRCSCCLLEYERCPSCGQAKEG